MKKKLLVIAFATIFSPAVLFGQMELVSNGGFEDGPGGWDMFNGNSELAIVSDIVSDGDSAAKVFKNGFNYIGIKQDITDKINAVGSGDFTLSADFYAPTGFTGTVQIYLIYSDEAVTNQKKYFFGGLNMPNEGLDQWISKSSISPIDFTGVVSSAVLEINTHSGDGTQPFYADNISLITYVESEMVPNGGFEEGTSMWSAWNGNSAYETVDTPVASGDSALKVFKDGQNYIGVKSDDIAGTLNCFGSGDYKLTADIYAPAAFGDNGRVKIVLIYSDDAVTNKTQYFFGDYNVGANGYDQWNHASGQHTFAFQGDVSSARIEVNRYGGDGSAPFYVDNISLITTLNNTCGTEPEAPLAPSDLTSTDTTYFSTTLSWTDNSDNEDGFAILQDGMVMDSTDAPPFTVDGLTAETSYDFRIYAYNATGNSDTTAAFNVITKAAPATAPDAPTDLVKLDSTLSSVSFSWTDNSDDELGFVIQLAGEDKDTVGANVTMATIMGLEPITAYDITVYAYNDVGNSSSAVLAIGTSSNTQLISNGGFEMGKAGWGMFNGNSDFSIVTNPVHGGDSAASIFKSGFNYLGINYDFTDKFKTLEDENYYVVNILAHIWIPAGFAGNVETNVTYNDNSGKNQLWVTSKVNSEHGTDQWVIRTGQKAIMLDGEVSSAFLENYTWGGDGTKPWYLDDVSVIVSRMVPVVTPNELVAIDSTDSSVTISWTDNSDFTSGFVVLLNGDSVMTVQDTTAVVTGLDASTAYEFGVSAFNQLGSSDTIKITAGTKAAPVGPVVPAAPTGLASTTITDTEIGLKWTDASDNEDGFYVQVKEGSNWVNMDTLAANATSGEVSGLTEGTEYTLRVAAFNAAGEAASNEIKVTTTSATGIQDLSGSWMKLMPNPVNDILYIETEAEIKWTIMNISGKMLMSGREQEINVAGLESGVYFIKVYNQSSKVWSDKKILKR